MGADREKRLAKKPQAHAPEALEAVKKLRPLSFLPAGSRAPREQLPVWAGGRREELPGSSFEPHRTCHLPPVSVVGPRDSNPEPADHESGSEAAGQNDEVALSCAFTSE